ncbi:MAG TPA: hypothetical protein VJ728_14320, partial [Candidatus Binataceae bacterium]|nr:hypothetical protein [Candidatus Binataceae bacterium]
LFESNRRFQQFASSWHARILSRTPAIRKAVQAFPKRTITFGLGAKYCPAHHVESLGLTPLVPEVRPRHGLT